MESNIIYCSDSIQDITAAEDSIASKVIDAIVKGLGKFGRSLGSLASSLMDSGYDIGKVTREPTETKWLVGNDEYKKTKGQSGYLCEVTIKPHPIQGEGEPTYSLSIQTVSGLNEHSFVAENITQDKAGKVIRATMASWDAADNQSAESVKQQYDVMLEEAKDLISQIKTACQSAHEKVKAADESGSLGAAIDDLQRQATDATEDLTKKFQRAFRDAKSLRDKISICTQMGDNIEDYVDNFNRALKQIIGESEEEPEAEQPEGQPEEEPTDEDTSDAMKMFQMESGEFPGASTQIDFKKSIIACVCHNKVDGESTVELKRIYSAIDPNVVMKALETVLYDASVQETLPEGQLVALQITDEDTDYDVNLLEQVTSVQIRDVFVELLKCYYKFYFNMKTLCWNATGPDGSTICDYCNTYADKAYEQIGILSDRCVATALYVPNPTSFISAEDSVNGSMTLDLNAALALIQSNLESLINCLELYRCDFDEVLCQELAEWADDWRNGNLSFISKMES